MRKAELLFIKYCAQNKLEKIQAYLTLAQDFEVDINAVDDGGLTAAYRAAKAGNTEVIRVLAATGLVDWNKGNQYGVTPLHVALGSGQSDVAGIIMKQDNINLSLQTRDGNTLAMCAVYGERVRCVEILVGQENFTSWNIPKSSGYTPLMMTIETNMKNILKILLDCPRVELNQKDQYGNSPVMMAIKEEKTDMAKMLIHSSRVDLGVVDGNGVSLHRIAREKGLPGVCDLLFETMAARMGQQEASNDQLKVERTSFLKKIPECPVCLDQFKKDRPVYSCPVGHHICGSCKANIQVCPTCQRPVSGEARAHDFEKLVNDFWG